ncbi:caiD [Symbiodinium pilosum]|uniref:CaiD protein n=1 Tax=Symbiodinium pilosum TaxID=2952 RepID=A0A812RPI9_SYMPI|nr:caiD [Symbiodinium pilosum]
MTNRPPAPGTYDPRDWKCPNCKTLNFKKRKNCLSCATERPPQTKDQVMPDWRTGKKDCGANVNADWTCRPCGRFWGMVLSSVFKVYGSGSKDLGCRFQMTGGRKPTFSQTWNPIWTVSFFFSFCTSFCGTLFLVICAREGFAAPKGLATVNAKP